jgi:hypothetical protein
MATVAPQRFVEPSAERRFYSRMAIFMVAVVFLGFAPSFYLRGYVTVPRPNPTLPPMLILHGLLFTLWMLVFVAQTQLVAAGRRDLHIKLGSAALVLAVALIPLMYLVAVWQVERANQMPFTTPLNWSIVPLALIPAYAVLLWNGWNRRRDGQWHKRMMLGAALVMMDPAIGRTPLPPILPFFALSNLLAVATFVPLLMWDKRSLGRIHPATLFALAVVVLMHLVRLAFLATGSWEPIARHLPGV